MLGLDASRDVIAAHSVKERFFSVNSLCSLHARVTRATPDKRTGTGTETGLNPRDSVGLQTVYLLGPEPVGCSRSRDTVTHRAPGDTAVSITSLSELYSYRYQNKHTDDVETR